ncbi:MAG: hypothetical protein KJN85_17185 [Maribacter sp.]|nr:hypothetical protein [Maribacter sp.]
MKTIKNSKLLFLIIILCSCHGLMAQCREISINDMTRALKGLIEPSLSIVMDRDNSMVSMLGSTERFSLPAQDISKPAHDWRYWVQDIRSDDSNLWWDERAGQFVLDVRFEGNGSEIKGTCPGCLVGNKDNRAPDINWKGGRIARLRMRPIPYDGSVTIEVLSVELFGEFEVNGVVDSFFPRLIRNMKNNVRNEIQTNAMNILNERDRRENIATRLRPILEAMDIRNITRIRRSGDNVLFCSS